ncbi:hypothetical protein [Anaerobacillus alkalilacustris]|uniref:hypothetical protein n=1 Tax=Anaerobacillus alkalilacustris TaxID=393763 RepID=UPI000A01BD5B|nr:hypothetical protein [Anaerobacillus alkalilacustris]
MIGIFVKVSVYFYSGLLGLEHIFKISYRFLVIPTGLLIPLTTSLVAAHIVEHFIEGGEVLPYFFHLEFQLGIPFLLLIVTLFQKKREKSNNKLFK